MWTAIERSYNHEGWDRSNTTLKIFMAPEFFWRGPRGAYLIEHHLGPATRRVFEHMNVRLAEPRFKDWVFILGTVVALRLHNGSAELNEELPIFDGSIGGPRSNVTSSYYNFAPIQIGGETTMMVHFKHHLSKWDFPATEALHNRVKQPFPAPTTENCYINRGEKGCSYSTMSSDDLERFFGFEPWQVLQDGIFQVKGLRIGLEICLDHRSGTLATALGPSQTVDIHLISSGGMNIAAGPVCTGQGGPVFMADGFARTAMTLNLLGRGREAELLPSGKLHYDVGVVYGADSLVALGQWIGLAVEAVSGHGFGVRYPGFGTLPGGARGNETGIHFQQVAAFGSDWKQLIHKYFDTSTYLEIGRIYDIIKANVKQRQEKDNLQLFVPFGEDAASFPTVDIYGPIPLLLASPSLKVFGT